MLEELKKTERWRTEKKSFYGTQIQQMRANRKTSTILSFPSGSVGNPRGTTGHGFPLTARWNDSPVLIHVNWYDW